MKKYTKKQIEILQFVKVNGMVNVELTPSCIQQNKNFYHRIKFLELNGALIVERREGECSLYTITNLGVDLLTKFQSKIKNDDLSLLWDKIQSCKSLSPLKKKRMCEILSYSE